MAVGCRGLADSPPAAAIASFTATPATITVGQSATLAWTTTNATHVNISGVEGSQAASGSITVTPGQSTSYTLTAVSTGGNATANATVTVMAAPPPPAPVITSFAAQPTTITLGQSTTLTWATQNAAEVTITGVPGEHPASGSATVAPQATGDFTLTATGAGGAVTSTVRVTVNSPIVIKTFTAQPSSISPGGQSTLTWAVEGAQKVTINGVEKPAFGSETVTPAQTTTYSLLATGAGSTPPAQKDVIVAVSTAGGIKKIQHIIFMVQENRSFDHYFGKLNDYRIKQGLLPEIDGIPPDFANPKHDSPDLVRPFHLRTQCIDNPTPSWNDAHVQRNRLSPSCTAESCSEAKMDGFVADAAAYARNRNLFDTEGYRAMGFYTEEEIPYYYFMATQFATSNRFFSPLMARTQPNLLFLFAATSGGYIHAPGTNDPTLSNKTIFQLLEEANISWKFYMPVVTEANVFFTFQPFANQHRDKIVPIEQYFTDLKNGTLPAVAFIASKAGEDEHPGPDVVYDPSKSQVGVGIHMQWGVQYVANIVNSLMKSSSWPNSVFIWSMDEAGGLFDHVPPQTAVPPDDTPPRFTRDANGNIADVIGDFSHTGFRIPLIVISPYTKKHYVSNTVMDLTAILKLIEERWDLPSLTRRDAAQPSMTEFFDFDNPPWLTPPTPPTQPGNMLCDRTKVVP